jgi:NADH:ubiquinone oxidoreductase subunit 4 (subunit M)
MLCLTSIFSVHSLFAYIFCVSQVLGTVAAFWTFNRILMGYPTVIPTWIDGTSLGGTDQPSAYKAELFKSKTKLFKSKTKWTTPLSRMEFYIVLPLIVSILWLGCKPMG